MESPWNIDDSAFDPMFTESVTIRHKDGSQTKSQTITCVVFSGMTGDPLSGDTMDTEREDISISFRNRDWAFIQSLARGDEVVRTTTNGKRYKVSSVEYDEIMGWVIKAREK